MPRPRVLSFMSEWGGGSPHRRPAASTPQSPTAKQTSFVHIPPSASTTALDNFERSSPSPVQNQRTRSDSRPSSRPMSMIQTYQPPMMEVGQDTLPELQRIFTFLNSHSNKLYQEGYFLKFHDTDSRGRPAADRQWQECFAQLVGTILSLWDASELDRVGTDSEVLPTFINLTDAAIVMMPSMTLNDGKKLENILSVSTAASNKYLFHFNSFNSLCQWTAGIRLAMYEHTTLQEAYTGALIAGKGKTLNNIRAILDRQRPKHEDWARVRFGAGTPWRRCWCVVMPPDEKEYAKLQKTQKKQTIYNRSPIVLKGEIKFYDTNKIKKKTRPLATVREAYSCYAIYPQSKPLIDQSTLVKIEGKITIHSNPESTTEGFVFIMPETRPAVSGFEIMLQFLFPVFDTFALYGRPTKLISDVLDTRGLMFAMPPDRRYGYLEMWDVVSLIHTEGSQNWTERQWRKQLKDLTSKRMTAAPSRDRSRTGSRRNTLSQSRTSLPPSRSGTLRFEENGSVRSQPSSRRTSPSRQADFEPQAPRRVDSAPPTGAFGVPRHQRSVSEAHGYKQYHAETPSRLAHGMSAADELDTPPLPPQHRVLNGASPGYETASDGEGRPSPEPRNLPQLRPTAANAPPRGPIASPPNFIHSPSQKPPTQPYQPPATMKPNAHIDPATLHQLQDINNAPLPGGIAVAGAAAAWKSQDSLSGRRSGDYDRGMEGYHGVQMDANARGLAVDQYQHSHTPRSGHSGSKLPTIPASPYIEQPEFVESPSTFQPTAPPVPEHAELPQTRNSAESAQRPRPSSSSSQIHRKPVPGRSSTSSREETDSRSIASSSLGSLRNDIVDPQALDMLEYTDPSLLRNPSKSSSRYDDDAASTTTPDYASTASEEIQPRRLPLRREDRPRSGVLKFVGNPDLNPKPDLVVGDAHYKPDAKPTGVATDIPTIDFGPTYSLNPDGKRPGTSGTMTQALQDSASRSKENLAQSPSDQKRQSYLSGRSTPNAPLHMRSSSASPQASDARSIAWQPGMATAPPVERQRLDAEEWVQHRASNSFQPRTSPVHAHGRSKSHTPPPLNRQQSGDWTHLQRTPEGMPARPPSRPLSRPLSRGAGNVLVNERPTSLSAREQEQVAKMTGTPLIDLTRNPKDNQKPSSSGLVGYVENREQERAAAKANRHTPSMQAEIDRRIMAQHRQMQQMNMTQSNYAPSMMGAPSVMGVPSMMGTPPAAPQAFAYSNPAQLQMYQQQGYFPGPGMSPAMSQGMSPGWGSPNPQPMQQQPIQGQYGAGGFNQQQQRMQQQQQQIPVTQPYGASFDQAQAAARFAHQQGYRRQ